MSKITDALNQIWYEQDGKQIKIGLTRDFLAGLDECWHILPGNNRQIKAKSPLMTVETNDCLRPVLSPVSGNVLRWENKATNFPDQLTENDVVMILTSEKLADADAAEFPPPPPGFNADEWLAARQGRATTATPTTMWTTAGGAQVIGRTEITGQDFQPPPAAPAGPALQPWQRATLIDTYLTLGANSARTQAGQLGLNWDAVVLSVTQGVIDRNAATARPRAVRGSF